MDETAGVRVTTPTDCELTVSRTVAAPPERVFEAWTQPDRLRRWMCGNDAWPLVVCEGDPRPGGELRWEWHHADGSILGLNGTYREVVAPSRIVHTERWDEDWTGGEALVTLDLVDLGGATAMHLTVRYSSREARDGALATGMVDGMAVSYTKLDALLADS